MSMLKFESFKGINNQARGTELTPADLGTATNVDVSNAGRLQRRQGYTVQDACCHANLFEAPGYLLATDAHHALVAIWPDGQRATVHPSMGVGRIWYARLPDGRVAFSNGLQCGITDGRTGSEWGARKPDSVGVAVAAQGSLAPGKYRWAVTHVRRADGLESGGVTSDVQEVAHGGLALMGLPEREGFDTQVYLTQPGGEQFFRIGRAAGGQLRITAPAGLGPARTLDLDAPPAGILLAEWNGRALVAVGSMLLASLPTMPEQFDLTRDYRQFGAAITLVQPVGNGIFVGTTEALHFLSGETWDTLRMSTPMTGPVALGSGVAVDGRFVRLGEGNAEGECMLALVDGVITAGLPSGQAVPLSEGRYRTEAQEVSAAFRLQGRMPQYMVQVLR